MDPITKKVVILVGGYLAASVVTCIGVATVINRAERRELQEWRKNTELWQRVKEGSYQ